ncbi:PQQ-binding-like beta-propeller repeat protein [Streptomyces xiangluensis]|uniref:PQQ-binding-like beta-propeller repeat protein n=1 Tax=Streptomyces xiangluensis TaxID=2665720 RepID=A0ABV8YLH6_9ACTN
MSACLQRNPSDRPTAKDLLDGLARLPQPRSGIVPVAADWLPEAILTVIGKFSVSAPDRKRPGRVRWRASTGKSVWSSPAVSGGVVYFGSFDGHVYALDAATGKVRWKFSTDSYNSSSPAISGGIVYVGGYRNLYALDAGTGKLRWKTHTKGDIDSRPAVSGGVVYVGVRDGHVYALDAATGRVRWKTHTENYFSSPAVSRGVIYIGSRDKCLYALDAATGKVRWKTPTGGQNVATPTISGGVHRRQGLLHVRPGCGLIFEASE